MRRLVRAMEAAPPCAGHGNVAPRLASGDMPSHFSGSPKGIRDYPPNTGADIPDETRQKIHGLPSESSHAGLATGYFIKPAVDGAVNLLFYKDEGLFREAVFSVNSFEN